MSSIQVNTTQNISLDFELGSLGDRILARLLDWAVIIGYLIVCWIITLAMQFAIFQQNTWLIILLILPIVFYDLVCEIAFNGQSIGKRVLNIKVVSLDGNRPTLGQYLIRWLFRLVDFTLSQSFCAVICVAVSRKHQRLGDMVAGTAVVKTNASISLNETLYQPVAENYEVHFPEVINLKDSDIQLIKEVLIYHQRKENLLLLHDTADKIKSVLHIQSNMEPGAFLHTVTADFNYLASR